ncbi:MAG TPA: phenylalanine--tRNA ligase subunit beta [Thermoanaerobaculia bacterium]|nr:phenylalanine--tRNA ligase subunit beta [Thermoanaerobaculia bacterium]
MRISRDWLGDHVDLTDLSDSEIGKRLTEIGHAVEAVEGTEGETVFEIEFTTNRIDAMSHRGLARELAAAFGRELFGSPAELPAGAVTTGDVSIRIEAADLCSRYTGLVIRGVTVGESNRAIRKRLLAAGHRPINNIVDATNYVMLDAGHPLHAFDLDRIAGRRIIVRRGEEGERIRTLDGEMREAGHESVVIADANGPVAFGGIMGGAESEITGSTKNILLECAHFDPGTIRRTARRLGLRTDASYRFERGVDPNDSISAILRAASIIVGDGGGTPEQPIDVVARENDSRRIRLRETKLREASGGMIALGYALDLFRRLGMTADLVVDHLAVVVPSWRGDLREEADLIEEALRFYGFDNVPVSLPRLTTGDVRPDVIREIEERSRDLLMACGLTEAINYSFISPDHNMLFSGEQQVRITNALTENLSSMRLSMIPGLLETVAFNRSYGIRDGALFEVGRTYHRRDDAVRERPAAGIVMFGSIGEHWGDPKRPVDFFDLKGVLEAMLDRLHVPAAFHPSAPSWAKEGGGSTLLSGERQIAILGLVSRAVAQHFGIKGDVLAAEIDLEQLEASARPWTMEPVAKFPGIPMVLGLLHGRELDYGSLLEVVRSIEVPHLQQVGIRDRYVPEGSGEVKTTLGMWYQAYDRSLTQEEVTEAHTRLAERIAERLPVKLVSG